MTPKNLYLMRHGATEMSGRYVGSTDVPLSVSGVKQVKKTANILKDKSISRVFCSPMQRCRQTYDLLRLNCQFEFDQLLREIDFGRWETKNFQEICQSDEKLINNWANNPENFSFPGGEALSAFQERVSTFKKRLDDCLDEDILVVAHGGTIRYLLCYLLGLPTEKYLLFQVEPGSFTSLQLYSEGAILTGFNIAG